MKIVLIPLLLIVYSNSLLAMDDEEIAQDEKEEKAPREEDAWRALLIPLCQNYKRYLPAQYNCICTKIVHTIFQSATRLDEVKKFNQLEALIQHLTDKDWDLGTTSCFINIAMLPYRDEYGKTFQTGASQILQLYVSASKQDESRVQHRHECIICLDGESMVTFQPCGHLVACTDCEDILKINQKTNKCPKCNALDSSTVRIECLLEECELCQKAQADVLFVDCQHVTTCQGCQAEECPRCKDSRIKIRIFF